jgi:hypothetical protein
MSPHVPNFVQSQVGSPPPVVTSYTHTGRNTVSFADVTNRNRLSEVDRSVSNPRSRERGQENVYSSYLVSPHSQPMSGGPRESMQVGQGLHHNPADLYEKSGGPAQGR